MYMEASNFKMAFILPTNYEDEIGKIVDKPNSFKIKVSPKTPNSTT